MSLVAGADGEKSVFKDDIQVNHISENTVGHGVRVKGISDPTTYPVLTGDMGEVFGDVDAGTGGNGYQYRNNTAITNSYTSVISMTLTKGVYLVGGSSSCYRGDSATMGELATYIAIGGNQASQTAYALTNNTGAATAHVCLPLIITDASAAVTVVTKLGSGTPLGPTNTIWAVRIA